MRSRSGLSLGRFMDHLFAPSCPRVTCRAKVRSRPRDAGTSRPLGYSMYIPGTSRELFRSCNRCCGCSPVDRELLGSAVFEAFRAPRRRSRLRVSNGSRLRPRRRSRASGWSRRLQWLGKSNRDPTFSRRACTLWARLCAVAQLPPQGTRQKRPSMGAALARLRT